MKSRCLSHKQGFLEPHPGAMPGEGPGGWAQPTTSYMGSPLPLPQKHTAPSPRLLKVAGHIALRNHFCSATREQLVLFRAEVK